MGSINIDNLDLVKAIYESKSILNNELFDWLVSNVNSGDVIKAHSNINISYSNILKREISNANFDLSLELSNLELKLLNYDDVLVSRKTLLEYKDSQITIISNKNTINKLAVNDIIFTHQLNSKNGKIKFKIYSQVSDLIQFLDINDIYKLNVDEFAINKGDAEFNIALVVPFDEKFDFHSIKRTISGNLYNVDFKEHSFNNFLIDSSLDLLIEINTKFSGYLPWGKKTSLMTSGTTLFSMSPVRNPPRPPSPPLLDPPFLTHFGLTNQNEIFRVSFYYFSRNGECENFSANYSDFSNDYSDLTKDKTEPTWGITRTALITWYSLVRLCPI